MYKHGDHVATLVLLEVECIVQALLYCVYTALAKMGQ